MQEFIAYGRISSIPNGAYGKTAKGTSFFKFDFVCHSSQLDKDGKPIPSFFHVQVYGKQADVMYDSLSVGSPILLKGEIVQTTYKNDQGQNRTYQYIAPSLQNGITFLESKEAAMQRKQVQASKASHISDDPIPMDVDSPF